MIIKSNDHDKNPEKANELHKEMTTGNKLGLQYSLNLSITRINYFMLFYFKAILSNSRKMNDPEKLKA